MVKVIIYIILFLNLSLHADVIINDNKSTENFKIYSYEDKSSSLTIDNIKEKKFIQTNNSISNGFTNSTFWYRVTIKNDTPSNIERYLKASESILHTIDFYVISNNKLIKHTKSGVGYFEDGKINFLERAFVKFSLKKDEKKTIYLKLTSYYPMFNSFKIYTKSSMDKFEYKYSTVYAFLLGSLLSLALYNLMIFFYTKDKAYIFYVFYSLSFICWQTSISGLFPFDTFLDTESYYFVGASIPLLITFLILFTNSILDIKSLSKRYYYLLNSLALFYTLLAVWSIFDFKPAITIMNGTATIILPLLIFIGYKSYKSGNKIAIFYLLAQGFFLSLATLFSLSTYGYMEYSTIARHGIIVGSFIEMIFFSLALAYKIKLLEEEKLVIANKAKENLEQNVKIRTKELEKSKKKLEILANKDYLSNLYNRRSLFNVSEKLINLAKRENTPLSLLLFDIDHFKNINDTYGHNIGDETIKVFSKTLLEDRRNYDIVSRIGGEEFVILQPSTSLEDAYKIAEEIRQKVETANQKDSNYVKYTVSCGVATLDKNDNSLDELMIKADKNLYEAKRSGRNKVIAK